ncbi:hypothetical protein [Streptomyces sp. NPDC001070]
MSALAEGDAQVPPQDVPQPSLPRMLRDRGYAGTLLLAALFGIPFSLAAFVFTTLCRACSPAGSACWSSPASAGHRTGLATGALSLPSVPAAGIPDAAHFLRGMPLAVLIGYGVTAVMALGRRVADRTGRHTPCRAPPCAPWPSVCASPRTRRPPGAPRGGGAVGAVRDGRSTDLGAWPVAALLLLVLFKGLGWSICLGSLRGGPIFPRSS